MLQSADPTDIAAQRQLGAERRRAPRIQVTANGRLMVSTGLEYPCRVADISENGVAFVCEGRPALGDRIIAYLDHLGRFEGLVTRQFETGFAIETHLPDNQRQRLAERIAWLEEDRKSDERRVFPRRAPGSDEQSDSALLIGRDDTQTKCRVLDVSITGAHIEVRPRPDIGTHVTVGKMLGRVVRHTSDGVGIEFLAPRPR